jgi:hypothetical protein
MRYTRCTSQGLAMNLKQVYSEKEAAARRNQSTVVYLLPQRLVRLQLGHHISAAVLKSNTQPIR